MGRRNHPSRWAFLLHRLSGIALAAFLPIHFWVLGHALEGSASLDAVLAATDHPMFKVGEWGLVTLLSFHLFAGLRLLVVEFLPWRGLHAGWVAGSVAGAVALGLGMLLGLSG